MRMILVLLIAQMVLFSCGNPHKSEEKKHSTIAFIGNSFQDEGIDFNHLRLSTGCDIEHLWEGGVASAWWYAMLNRKILLGNIPDYVVMTTYTTVLTQPSDRTTGIYWTKIEHIAEGFPQVLETVKAVLKNAEKITDIWDFPSSVDYSFLPLILELCQKNSIQLIFTQMRLLDDVESPISETEIQKNYMRDLLDYLTQWDVLFLDYSKDPEIESSDFSDGWHLNPRGKSKWTSLILHDFNDFFNHKQPFHQTSGIIQNSPLVFLSPQSGECIKAAQNNSFRISPDKKIKWSYLVDGTNDCEKYLGTGTILDAQIPPVDYQKRKLTIYAYDGYQKQSILCSLLVQPGINLPPTIDAGQDLISYIGRETVLKVAIIDDSLSSQNITCKWEIIRGSAVIKNPTSQTPTIIPSLEGHIIVRANVSDGEYTCVDDISINVNANNEFIIESPKSGESYTPKDTLLIKWNVVDVEDCVLSISYDNGKMYNLINNATISIADPTWERFPWLIPDDAPKTNEARIKLSNYQGTVNTITSAFTIK